MQPPARTFIEVGNLLVHTGALSPGVYSHFRRHGDKFVEKSNLLVAYRAMPNTELEERIRLMQLVMAEREQAIQPSPATDGVVIDFRGAKL